MGARYFDGRQASAHAVTLAMEGGQVLIRLPDGAVADAWPLNGMRADAEPGGAVRFHFGTGPARLVVDDPADLALLLPAVRRRPRRPASWGVALAACMAVLWLGVALVHSGPDLLAPLVPAGWEAGLGAGVESAMLRGGRCNGAEGQAALDRLVARLAPPGGPVQAVVADDPMVNAFTLPGRRVVVMRGLIASAGDGDELAGVVAHELGHVAHRDPLKRLLRAMGLNVVAAGLGWGGVDGAQVAGTLLGLSYGRAAEAAADEYALQSLHAAGLRADGLARFFARIGHGGELPAFLSDHPATAERQARAAQAGMEGAPAFSPAEWDALRGMCAK